MTREFQIGHLLGARELMGLPTEMALQGAATRALSGVDAQLKVDREPIRAMAAEAVMCKRADARAKAKAARQGGPSLVVAGDGVTPLTAVAGEVTAGGSAQRCLNLKTQKLKLEDLANHPLFNPVIMAFGS